MGVSGPRRGWAAPGGAQSVNFKLAFVPPLRHCEALRDELDFGVDFGVELDFG